MARFIAMFPLVASGMKCGDVKAHYKEGSCCKNPEKELDTLMSSAECPYSFEKPHCMDAGAQAPRDVSDNSMGYKAARFSPLHMTQLEKLQQTNVHLHLGAEHFSKGEYDKPAPGHSHGRRLEGGHDVRPGFFCGTEGYNVEDNYEFQYCKDTHVGETYEIHWVFSSAGVIGPDPWLTDGLGQAANGRGLLNPILGVQAQVFFVVNDDEYHYDDMLHGGVGSIAHDFARYAGSTTGQSHDNEVCSPYAVTWMVDRKCHPISAKALDNLCMGMSMEYGMYADLHPHGSRKLVDPMFVVPWDEVVIDTLPPMPMP